MPELTGSTRESKDKIYAIEKVTIVAKSYIGLIDNLATKVGKEVNEKLDMKTQLSTAMKALGLA